MIALALAVAIVTTQIGEVQAADLARQALEAQGGDHALRGIKTTRLRETVVTNALEQSVRPDGPFFENHEELTETRRFDSPALLTEGRTRGYNGPWFAVRCWTARYSLVVGGVALTRRGDALVPQSQAAVAPAEESLALGPERVLLTALAAGDLRQARATRLNGYMHDVLAFTWQGAPVRLFLQPGSHLPVVIEIVRARPLDMFWSGWGDVTTRVEWDAWTREPNGVRYPRRWTVTANGRLYRSVMIDDVSFDSTGADAGLAAPVAAIAQARAAARPIRSLPFRSAGRTEVAPGITLFQGPWNVVQVDMPEGTYVVEAPISTGYSAGVIAEVRRSGKRFVGLVTTSDSWPHIAGVREYVAERVRLLALDLNVPILRKIVASPRTRCRSFQRSRVCWSSSDRSPSARICPPCGSSRFER